MKTKFDEQLEEMHVELIKMGSLCEQAITLSSRALLGDEKNQVEQVYSVDSEIDQQEREIENICMRLLLLQRPFASDLLENLCGTENDLRYGTDRMTRPLISQTWFRISASVRRRVRYISRQWQRQR